MIFNSSALYAVLTTSKRHLFSLVGFPRLFFFFFFEIILEYILKLWMYWFWISSLRKLASLVIHILVLALDVLYTTVNPEFSNLLFDHRKCIKRLQNSGQSCGLNCCQSVLFFPMKNLILVNCGDYIGQAIRYMIFDVIF